ncbi:MAG: hypothetical protein KDC38_14875 [Planctomycetes bacterium]|nr:hypothetical protein [Planctomycetota bacterium]
MSSTLHRTRTPIAWLFSALLFVGCLGLAVSCVSHSSVPSPNVVALQDTTPENVHVGVFADAEAAGQLYPSARLCQPCHQKQYQEWAVSPHAYAQVSPVFQSFHAAVIYLTNGTNGDFCIRCHSPVGMALEEPFSTENANRAEAAFEGITCIVCHRVDQEYGKISGRMKVHTGDLFAPVYGPGGDDNLQKALASNDFNLKSKPEGSGNPTHANAKRFFQLTQPGFCGSCHDVLGNNAFRLEEAFSEYKASPSAKNDETCQDCHMATVQGIVSDYENGPAAVVAGNPTPDRRLTNHLMAGPDHSVAHPGIYPHNVDASEFATIREWIAFDVDAGWGTTDFERTNPSRDQFPERWRSREDRIEARRLIDQNLERLDYYMGERRSVLQEGYRLGQLRVGEMSSGGFEFEVDLENGTDGHGVPTGFIAERVVFLRTVVTDANGKQVFFSGDYDPNGDVRDSHSLYVHAGELPMDEFLLSLQSKFITTNVRGGEREQVLAVNYSVDPLPFTRPPTSSRFLVGRPGGSRIHKLNIMPGDKRTAKYEVTAEQLAGTEGPYHVSVEVVAGMVPVNLIAEISVVGFDYDLSAREIADRVLDGHVVLWAYDVELQPGAVYSMPTRTGDDYVSKYTFEEQHPERSHSTSEHDSHASAGH